MPAATTDPAAVLDLYLAARAVHAYGIADVVQLWGASRWWRDGPAAVGVMALPEAPVPVVYAVSASADAATLDLLDRLQPVLPNRFVVHGPRGLDTHLAATFHAVWAAPYLKLQLTAPELLPAADPDAVVLGQHHVDALAGLYGRDATAETYFHPGLVDSGHYVGRWIDGQLVAAAGIHVIEPRHGVAAVANVATHPDHRGHGLGRSVVATLCRRLLDHVDVIALNVRERNRAARRLYDGLGFTSVARYTEAEVARRGASSEREVRGR